MIESIDWRVGWGFVVGGVAALTGLWYAHGPLEMSWAGPAYVVVAVVVSLAALVVAASAFVEAGGGGPREWHALSDLYALVNEAPWWSKALVLLAALAWVPGPWGWLL